MTYEEELIKKRIEARRLQTADSSFTEESSSACSSMTEIIGELYGEKGVDPNSKKAIEIEKHQMQQTKDSYHRHLH
jgi:hypothetical protein